MQGTLAVIAISFICRLIEQYVLHLGLDYLMYAFEARADSLMIGCLLAVLVASGQARTFVNLVAARTYFLPITLLLLILSGIATLNDVYNVVFRSTVEAGLAAILIVQLLALPAASMWNLLDNRWSRYFGKISYSVYLYHGLCRRFVEVVLNVHEPYIVALLGLALTIIVASTSFYLVEMTFIKLGKRKKSAAARVEPSEVLSDKPRPTDIKHEIVR